MSNRVILESAGSHVFDLGHIRREGAEELVELLLDDAGFSDRTWRLQVQKKLTCNSDTPPVRVVDGPKKWAVYLKIKPGDNNSCHYCSLLMPDGLQGETVWAALRRVDKGINRNWRHALRARNFQPVAAGGGWESEAADSSVSEPAPANSAATFPAPPEPITTNGTQGADMKATIDVPPSSTDDEGSKSASRGWVADPEKLRLMLMAVAEIQSVGGLVRDNGHFSELFAQKLGWRGLNRYEIGGVFTGLVRRGYIMRVFRGSKPIGYALTDDGYVKVKDVVGPEASAGAAAKTKSVPAIDPAKIILSFGQIAQQFAEAKIQLEQIETRETDLTRELADLRQKKADICKLLEDQEVQQALSRLIQVKNTQPK